MPTVKLTDKAAAAAKAGAGQRLELWDSDVRGLCLRVSDQSKVWVFRYRRPDGSQPRFRIGTYADKDPAADADVDDGENNALPLTLAQARRRARRLKVTVEDGGDPAAEKRQRRAAAKTQTVRTLADLAEVYFTACETGDYTPRKKRKRASTLAEERGLWSRHLKSTDHADLRVEDVSSETVRRVMRSLVQAGKETTANRVRALMRQLFNYAISEGRLAANPVAQVAARAEKPRQRVLRDEELRALWQALDDPAGLTLPADEGKDPAPVYIGEPVRIALKLLALTLTRRAEVAGMRTDELDLPQATWTIPAERTKAGRAHLIPLAPEAVRLIKRALELGEAVPGSNHRHVFQSPRDKAKAITAGALSHAMRDLALALDLADRPRTHDLRRTAATIMASERMKVSPFVIGRLLDHATEKGGAASVTLAHYALYDFAAEKRAALTAWGAVVADIATGRGADAE